MPDFHLEEAVAGWPRKAVAGTDEAGRGPLAGPVVAAAVILDPARVPAGLNDSKKLGKGARNRLFAEICGTAIWAVGSASVEEIDTLNILRASHLAMCRAISGLARAPGHVLVDGNLLPRDLSLSATACIGGDGRSLSIAAASIMAKVERDRIMADLAHAWPGYGWEQNAGYPTKAHLAALSDLGITPHHRRSFRPVHNILYQEEKLSR